MAQQPAPHPVARESLFHAFVHGLQVFGIAFVAQVAVLPHQSTSRDAWYSLGLAAIRAFFAAVHH